MKESPMLRHRQEWILSLKNQIFHDKKLMNDSLALYAIQNNFEYIVYKSDHCEYVLKCKGKGCKWRFMSSTIGQTDIFKVRYILNGHSCAMNSIIRDHTQAKSAMIGECIMNYIISS